jgi:hypothetical protein
VDARGRVGRRRARARRWRVGSAQWDRGYTDPTPWRVDLAAPSPDLNWRAAAVTRDRGGGRSWRGDSGVMDESNAPVEAAVFTR